MPKTMEAEEFSSAGSQRIQGAIDAEYDDVQDTEALRLMLADIRHYCDAKGYRFADLDQRGHDLYRKERNA